eukprot:5520318-Pyramimonas_sp.AAC.1
MAAGRRGCGFGRFWRTLCSLVPCDWFQPLEYALLSPEIGSNPWNMLSCPLRLVPPPRKSEGWGGGDEEDGAGGRGAFVVRGGRRSVRPEGAGS